MPEVQITLSCVSGLQSLPSVHLGPHSFSTKGTRRASVGNLDAHIAHIAFIVLIGD